MSDIYNQPQPRSSVFPDMPQQPLPNATAVMVLGILSIVACCCYGGGVILGIIALVLASKDMKRYHAAPTMYTPASLSNLKTGRICAIIGVSLTLAYIVFVVVIMGLGFATDPDAMREALEGLKR